MLSVQIQITNTPICEKTIIRQFTNDVVLDHYHIDGKIRGWICRQWKNRNDGLRY
ncbi:MAG: hypothetical protein EBX41_02730 [Chitinophagia bacterium]|nr:hypothetical protein [Chitinophagia bacterium]